MKKEEKQHQAFLHWLGCLLLRRGHDGRADIPDDLDLLEDAFRAGWGWGEALTEPALRVQDHRDGLHDGLAWAETKVDTANDFPCLLCGGDRYDGAEGIVHHEDCPLRVLRAALAHVEAHGTLPGEPQEVK